MKPVSEFIFANFSSPHLSILDQNSIPILKGIKTTSRLAYKPDVLPFILKSEYLPEFIKNPPQSTLTWEQCCEQRILHLENGRGFVYVMWSGGIDSTNALVAILKYGSADLKKRTIVLMSMESFHEFPEIFPLITRHFTIKSVYTPPENYLKKEDLLITGELGDQIFGSDFIYTVARLFGEEAVFLPYKVQVPKLFKALAGDSPGQACYENLLPIVQECPIPIKTAYDFFWWWNFSQKWQHVKFRVLFLNFTEPAKFVNQVIPFYDSPEFQWWSLQNHPEKIHQNLKTYKQPAKSFIVEYTGIKNYQNKPKIGSLKNIRTLRPKNWALLEDFSFASPETIKNYIRK